MKVKRAVPKQIVLEVTNRCQLRCRGCPSAVDSVHEFGTGFMAWDLFKSIVDRIDFPTTVVLWLNGEPLLHPKYEAMARYVTKRELRWYITTNGMIWNESLFRLITERNSCYQILFSVDGLVEGPSTSFENVRPGVDRDVVRENVFRVLRMRNSKPDSNLDVAVKLCERGQDYEEIENWIAWWLERGVDYCAVGKMLHGKTVGTRLYPCRYFDEMAMEVRWDGTVIPCSYHPEVANRHALDMGKLEIDQVSLLDFYNNERYQALREAHATGNFPEPCNTCAFAYCGSGMDGTVRFRSPDLPKYDISYHTDYYNTFYSRIRKRDGVSWR